MNASLPNFFINENLRRIQRALGEKRIVIKRGTVVGRTHPDSRSARVVIDLKREI